jgi:hypothetical protein
MPVLYLHAQPQDQPAWQATRAQLQAKAIVNPQRLPVFANDVYNPDRRKEQLREYSHCHGLVMLRTRDSDLHLDIKAMYLDRRLLWQDPDYRKNLPWAIVDQIGDDFPVAKDYGVPRVLTSDPDWPERLLQELHLR